MVCIDSSLIEEPAIAEYDFVSHDKVTTYPDRCSKKVESVLQFEETKHETILPESTIEPVEANKVEETVILPNRDIWLKNTQENNQLNRDTNPHLIKKKIKSEIVYKKEIGIRYLKPPKLSSPGDIIIQHEPRKIIAPAPPLIIRQMGPKPCTPEPLVVREAPPPIPDLTNRKVITIAGKGIPPPPRKVVVERLPQIPAKPQAVINERWLPYEEKKRRVIYKRPPPVPVFLKPKNVIVEWDVPKVRIESKTTFLGTINANPIDYVNRYGNTLKTFSEFPDILKRIKHDENIRLAADIKTKPAELLIGDVDALRLVNLEKEGLSEYTDLLFKK